MAFDLFAELEGLIDAFVTDGIDYALCGGLALAMHGHARATTDLDVLITAVDLGRARDAAKRVGFDIPARKMIFGLKAGTPSEVHRVSKIDMATGKLLPLDLLVVNRELEPVWNTREVRESTTRKVTVVSRAGLATMKRLAGRPQDLVDIAVLEGTTDDEQS